MLQASGTASDVNQGVQFYVAVKVATDSQFPFTGGDPFVVRVVDDAVVLTPPDCEHRHLELPPIEGDVREDALENLPNP